MQPQLPVVEEEFDMVVLSVGMEVSESVRELGRKLGVELDEYGFCHTVQFQPLQTSRPGIYAVGPFREPKDIPETVVDASGAAALAGGLLATRREDPDTLFFNRRLCIEGDTETGLHVKNLLDALEYDWESHFSAVLGAPIGPPVGRLAHHVLKRARQLNHPAPSSIRADRASSRHRVRQT
jgi:hypothetical protein